MAGLALEFIGFPQGSEVTPNADQIFNLAMIQGPFVALLMIIPFGIFSFYSIDRQNIKKFYLNLKLGDYPSKFVYLYSMDQNIKITPKRIKKKDLILESAVSFFLSMVITILSLNKLQNL